MVVFYQWNESILVSLQASKCYFSLNICNKIMMYTKSCDGQHLQFWIP
jgi:hypothetical protein